MKSLKLIDTTEVTPKVFNEIIKLFKRAAEIYLRDQIISHIENRTDIHDWTVSGNIGAIYFENCSFIVGTVDIDIRDGVKTRWELFDISSFKVPTLVSDSLEKCLNKLK